MLKCYSKIIFMLLILSLSGCSETATFITKNEVTSSTQMSDTIFLEPVESKDKIAFVDIKNTTDNEELNINKLLKQKIASKGYKITNKPKEAHYLIQANILQAGKYTPARARSALHGGYGAVIEGGAIGGSIGALRGKRDATIGGALAGAAIGYAANLMIQDVMYSTVVDVQISEKSANGVKINETHLLAAPNGTASGKFQFSNEDTDWKRYRTRIISMANKANLTKEEATPYLIAGITQSISGIM